MKRHCGTCGGSGHNARSCKAGARNAFEADEEQGRDYTCVLDPDGLWHLTQEQAAPPPAHLGGAWTSCVRYVEFKRGYDMRRPTCETCLQIVTQHEGREGASR